jgi:hypothetical protein
MDFHALAKIWFAEAKPALMKIEDPEGILEPGYMAQFIRRQEDLVVRLLQKYLEKHDGLSPAAARLLDEVLGEVLVEQQEQAA